jgi:hypothetical protein
MKCFSTIVMAGIQVEKEGIVRYKRKETLHTGISEEG